MNITIESVAISGDTAKMIGQSEGIAKEVDLPRAEFLDLCRDYPDKQFPFEMFLTHDVETQEPFLYMYDIAGDEE